MIDTSKIHRYLWVGRKDRHWYQRCQDIFTEIYGEDKLQLVCMLFAATSINTSLKSNLTLFRRALDEIENDMPVGRYLPNIQQQLNQIRAGKELTGRKINSFAKAMAGNRDAVVVDIWLLRAFNIDKKYTRHTGPHAGKMRSGGPTDRQYTIIENWVREESKAMGLQAREFSAMIWSGVRIIQSGDRDTTYIDFLKRMNHNLFSQT